MRILLHYLSLLGILSTGITLDDITSATYTNLSDMARPIGSESKVSKRRAVTRESISATFGATNGRYDKAAEVDISTGAIDEI